MAETRYSNVLLYDYEATNGYIKHLPDHVIHNYHEYINYGNRATQSLVVQPAVVLASGARGTDLYKYSVPFVQNLISRNLQFLDLEIDEDVVSKITQNFEEIGGPKYVMMIGVSQGVSDPVLPDISGGYESFIG